MYLKRVSQADFYAYIKQQKIGKSSPLIGMTFRCVKIDIINGIISKKRNLILLHPHKPLNVKALMNKRAFETIRTQNPTDLNNPYQSLDLQLLQVPYI